MWLRWRSIPSILSLKYLGEFQEQDTKVLSFLVSGHVQHMRYAAVDDCGTVINLTLVAGQASSKVWARCSARSRNTTVRASF